MGYYSYRRLGFTIQWLPIGQNFCRVLWWNLYLGDNLGNKAKMSPEYIGLAGVC